MFGINQEDLDYIFESAGQEVLVNDNLMNVIVTNPPFGEYEEKHIHSIQRVLQGDMVTLEGNHYLCLVESVTKRGGKYKTRIRHCNFIVEVPTEPTSILIGYSDFGEPIYEEVPGVPIEVPSFLETKSYSVTSGVWVTSNNEILVTMKDSAEYRSLIELGDEFKVMGKTWRITNLLLDKKGLITVNCERR
ncbi:hypothetical protein IOC57_06430 [Bacillus sp. SD075]|uniref:hypothetical protein n=1 Tax=Bacillus sp. SD075 TaxID=2781732 RepID=UPI001A974335|nr:hypothetical protein [Bacillus sp. SD075]MBO0997388.1 hypothetical protein [Bacillus sp. SD075]